MKLDNVNLGAAFPHIPDETDADEPPETGTPERPADREYFFVRPGAGAADSPEPAPDEFHGGAAASERRALHPGDGPHPTCNGSRSGETPDLQHTQG